MAIAKTPGKPANNVPANLEYKTTGSNSGSITSVASV